MARVINSCDRAIFPSFHYIGGMVPCAKDKEYIKKTVRAVREEAPNCLIHVFGCGNASLIPEPIEAGADSFDSSSYVRSAIDTGNSNGSSGIHSNLYAAVKQLSKINSIIGSIECVTIPNTKMFAT